MRQIDPDIIKERKKRVLQAVIHSFIKTGRPVSSHILTEEYQFDLSPATLRNLMAELEEDGLLTHPHTSAGRVPTDQGYRNYVDSLMELQRLVIAEEDRVRQEYDDRTRELEDLLVQTSHVLSALSHYSGFVLTPRVEKNVLQYLELIHLAEGKILVVMVTQTGLVKHRIVEADISRDRLHVLNRSLNERLRGLSLVEARSRILDEIEEMERQEQEIMNLARRLSQEIFDVDQEVYIEGTANVLTLPEFQDYEPLRSILRLREDKDLLRDLLKKDMQSDGVNVLIGSESPRAELRDLSVVSTVYKNGDNPVGVLGIIGPKRMEYPKMIALVGAVSRIVNKLLSRI